MLRFLVIGCQGATLLGTWPLWNLRDAPPLLPVLDLPQVPLGVALLASLALAAWRPLGGAALHSLLLVLAILLDRTREQPQVLSLALLLWATVPRPGLAFVGRAHLVVLWLASGLAKLAHPRFHDEGGRWLLGIADGPSHPCLAVALAVAAIEVGLGIASLVPRTRALAGVLGGSMHVAIAAFLVARGENHEVWAWNLALAAAAWTLFSRRGVSAPSWARAAAAGLALLPIAYELRLVSAAFSHQLYACAEPRATWLRADGTVEALGEAQGRSIRLPPSRWIYLRWFERMAAPGDKLVIEDDRWFAKWLGRSAEVVEQPGVRR